MISARYVRVSVQLTVLRVHIHAAPFATPVAMQNSETTYMRHANVLVVGVLCTQFFRAIQMYCPPAHGWNQTKLAGGAMSQDSAISA